MSRHDDSEGDGSAAAVLALDPHGWTPEGPTIGWLVGWTPGEGPTVDWPGNPGPPRAARTVVALDGATAHGAIAERRGVVLLFERNRHELPIVMGLLSVETEVVPENLEATIDGKRVQLEAADEIVLRCGQASLVLRRNGRVIIRGTHVETRSSGTNRIKGGSVLIN